ncbi:MAG: hypothetical protein L3J71_07750 [Victivallaceae bacterium]|nr:hypothetical protein [Victivallaceae bacterium]
MLQHFIIMLVTGLIVINSAIGKPVKAPASQAELSIYSNSKFPLLVCRYTLIKKALNNNFKEYSLNELKISLGKLTKPQAAKGRLRPLYPVFSVNQNDNKLKLECLFLLPANGLKFLKERQNSTFLIYSRLRSNQRYSPYTYNEKVKVKFIDDDAKATAMLQSTWLNGLKQNLTNNLNQYENSELETLLYLRFFNSIPTSRPKNWKSDNLAKLLFNISGLSDIRDAIPMGHNNQPLIEKATEKAPTPIMLPPVTVAQTTTQPGIAQWIPRSCYYIEWQNLKDMQSTLSGSAKQFDKWSPDTYPLSAAKIIDKYLKKIGLADKIYLKANLENNIESIVLAGWDPYFQSGTSILIVIKTKKTVTALPTAPYVSSPAKNIIMLSTSKKLYSMALNAHKKQRSIEQLNNFTYSRQRLTAQKDEQELCFIYLSDYWLTNFISPRWQILNNRLAELDARLRFIYLLKLCRNYELYPHKIPTVAELKNDPFLKPEFKNWLFAGLKEKNGIVSDKELGTLYDHPPIDQIPFKKVTPTELKRYNEFKRIYSRRWRQMDPIAFQLVKSAKDIYKTRLYVSPISNRSEFRSLSNFVSKQKPKHALTKINGKVMDISIAIPTTPLKGFGIQTPLPLLVFIQLSAFDFAPSSYSPATWLLPKREYDRMSYMRIPAALSVSSVVAIAARRLTGRMNFTPSQYKNIDIMQDASSNQFPLMRFNNSKNGLQYFGVDPTTLGRIRDNSSAETIVDTVPCDIRLSVDFIQGYQLRRKMWFEALKNRGLASWRRYNRLFRIKEFFSMQNSSLPNEIRKLHLFPVKNMVVADSTVKQIPIVRDTPQPKYQRSSNIIRETKKLPELLQAITGIDLFISVEPNALFFETHYRIPQKTQPASTTTPTPAPGRNTRNQPAQPTILDFDE